MFISISKKNIFITFIIATLFSGTSFAATVDTLILLTSESQGDNYYLQWDFLNGDDDNVMPPNDIINGFDIEITGGAKIVGHTDPTNWSWTLQHDTLATWSTLNSPISKGQKLGGIGKFGVLVNSNTFEMKWSATRGVNIMSSGALTLTDPAPIPIPASIWLFSSALLGFAGLKRKKLQNKTSTIIEKDLGLT